MNPPTPQTSITLFQLPSSRALRIAWLLEELSLPYTIITGTRLPNFDASPTFTSQTGGLGKSPTLHDGAITVQESGAIVDYLCETYPPANPSTPLLPTLSSPAARAKVREFMHLAEGTFMAHAYPALVSSRLPAHLASSRDIHEFRVITTRKVYQDMAWLEGHLAEAGTGYLVGECLTAADVMMGLAVQAILERVVKGGELAEDAGAKEYPAVKRWVDGLLGRKALKVAFKKTGFTA